MSNLSFKELVPAFPKTFNEDDFSKFVRENSKLRWTVTLAEFLQCTAKKTDDNDEKFLESSVFPEDPKANFKWCLRLYPVHNVNTNNNTVKFCGVFLFLESKKIKSPISIEAFFYCQNNNNLNVNLKEHFIKYTFEDEGNGYGNCSFMQSSVLQSYLTGGPVTFYAKVSAMCDANSSQTNKFTAEEIMQNNYLNLLENSSLSDVTFYTKDNTEFKVHMNILTVRSKSLATMLSDKLNENPSGKIIIEDFSGTTMKNLLRFIYCCKMEFLDVAETTNLLNAAEKYEILGLKLQCSDYLYSIIDEENVCSILLLAEQFNLLDLKQEAFKFMRGHKRKFSSVNSYDLILEKKPRLLAEISAEFVKFDECDESDECNESDESDEFN